MSHFRESAFFHLHHAWFNRREQFADIPAALAANALIPFFVWLLARVWLKFNSAQANFSLEEIVIDIGMTELLFITFIRLNSISRASGDFSIALARPRSWLMTSFSGLIGRATGGRVFMLTLLLCAFPLLGAKPSHTFWPILRLLLLPLWLGVLQGLFALLFASAQVLWHQTNYFILPFGKIFLVLGGVWGPVADFSEPWKDIILRLPPADLFFQPIYFCVKGQFYHLSVESWIARTAILAVVLVVLNVWFFNVARERHQSYGG